MAAFSRLRRPGGNGTGSVVAIRGLVRRLFGRCRHSSFLGRTTTSDWEEPFNFWCCRAGPRPELPLDTAE